MSYTENENISQGAGDSSAAANGQEAAAGQNTDASSVPWRKLHPLSPVARGGISFIIIFGVLFNFFREWLTDQVIHQTAPVEYLDGSDDALETPGSGSWVINVISAHGWAVFVGLGIFLFCLLAVLISWLSWRAARYRITASAVEEAHGIFSKTQKRAPLERIQSVNLQRQLIVRLLGLASVEIHTAGQGGNLQLNYLSFRQAQELREEILDAAFAKRNAREQRAGGADTANASTAHSASGVTAATVAQAGLPETQTAQGAVDTASRRDNFADRLGAHVDGIFDTDTDAAARAAGTIVRVQVGRLLGSILLSWTVIFFVLFIVAVVLLTFVGASVSGETFGLFMLLPGVIPLLLAAGALVYTQFNHGFNFTLSRAHDAVRVGSGLTSTQTETIPFGRIHALEVSQPLLWRPFGWWHVRVVTAGQGLETGTQKNSQLRNVVLPVGTAEDVVRVIGTVLPGTYQQAAAAQENATASAAATARLHAELTGTPQDFTGAGKHSWLLLLFAKKRAGMLLDTAAALPNLRIRRGFFTRRLGILPLFRAQSVAYSTPPLHRLCGAARIDAHTVPGFVALRMRGLDGAIAKQEFARLAAAVLRAQLGEARAEKTAHTEGETA